jgi:ADP-ribose pyrophosphatase
MARSKTRTNTPRKPAESVSDPEQAVVLAEGQFLRLVRRGRWEYAERVNATGAVAIVALTEDRQILFTQQRREPMRAQVLELPAGLMGDVAGDPASDTWKDAARRELLEEAGYQARSYKLLTDGPVSAGFGTETITMVMATGLRKVAAGGGVDGEDILLHVVPFDSADKWLAARKKKGFLVDPKVYAGLYFAGKYLASR